MAWQQLVGPLALLLVALVVDAWVFVDATARAEQHRPVVATLGRVTVETPAAWLAGCLLLWVVFVPLYLVARARS